MPKPSGEEKRRREILQAARGCFSQRGYHDTTMDEVATAAHLSKALIYDYFKNKQELFLAVLDTWFAGFDRAIEEIFASGSAVARLRQFAQLSATVTEESGELLSLIPGFWAHAGREPEIMGSFRRALRRYRRSLARVIEDGITGGEFRQLDPTLTAIGLLGALDGLWAHWAIDQQGFSLRTAVESLIENILHGLRTFKEDHE